MAFMLALSIALLTAVLVIKSKINKVQANIDHKIDTTRNTARKISTGYKAVKYFVKT